MTVTLSGCILVMPGLAVWFFASSVQHQHRVEGVPERTTRSLERKP